MKFDKQRIAPHSYEKGYSGVLLSTFRIKVGNPNIQGEFSTSTDKTAETASIGASFTTGVA